MAGGEAVEFLEAARVRMVGPLAAIVSFAESAGRISGRLEHSGDRALVEVQPLEPRA